MNRTGCQDLRGSHMLVHSSRDLRLQLANRVTYWAAKTEHVQRARRLMYLLSAVPYFVPRLLAKGEIHCAMKT